MEEQNINSASLIKDLKDKMELDPRHIDGLGPFDPRSPMTVSPDLISTFESTAVVRVTLEGKIKLEKNPAFYYSEEYDGLPLGWFNVEAKKTYNFTALIAEVRDQYIKKNSQFNPYSTIDNG